MPPLSVVAAIIQDEKGKILCAQRSATMALPELWEFPGGKIEAHEDAHTAIIREIEEELGCLIEVNTHLVTTPHPPEQPTIELICLLCHLHTGTPIAREHSQLRWLEPSELGQLDWCPADRPAVRLLQHAAAIHKQPQTAHTQTYTPS
jgi:8-oxo-dGTP diphosphatase